MSLKMTLKRLLDDERGQGESNTLYMLVIVAIIALVLLVVVKPMFNNSMKYSVKKAQLPAQATSAPASSAS
jgi:hypothetical protein